MNNGDLIRKPGVNKADSEESSAIDELDRKIVGALLGEARISFRDLGERIHLSPNATAERVRRLLAMDVIRGFHADINRPLLGYPLQAYIDVRLQPGISAKSFEAAITKIPEIVSATILTGSVDFRVRVACKSQLDLMRLIERLRADVGVQETNSTIICHEIEMRNAPA